MRVISCFFSPAAVCWCSGCEMLLGEAWADRVELGTALKPCYWHMVLAGR